MSQLPRSANEYSKPQVVSSSSLLHLALSVIAALLLSIAFSASREAHAQTPTIIYGVTTSNNLVSFSSANPSTFVLNVPITGLQAGENILGLDFRPATGQLYALGSTNRVYIIDPGTGVATQVGNTGAFTLSGTEFGFDFNPVPDRIRVTSDADQNIRLNPNDGTLAGTDTTLAYAAGDPNFGQNPNVVASGYTNNFAGTAVTTLYDIDSNLDILVLQGGINGSPSPNGGQLTTVGSLGVNTSAIASLDIRTGSDLTTTTAFAALNPNATTSSNLYTINLSTGAATLVGAIGGAGGPIVRGIAIPRVTPAALISEFRFRGPAGADDEFAEIYNNTDLDMVVSTADGSGGWALVSSDNTATPKFVIPNGTIIPARGHYLGVNSNGYSLNAYPAGINTNATGDTTYTTGIPDNAGIALFQTANPANFNLANRLDAAGFSAVPNSLYREGNGLTPSNGVPVNADFSFVRQLMSGLPQDTNNNRADFELVATDGNATVLSAQLGAAGPENLTSPIQRNATIKASLIEPQVVSTQSPNRVRVGSGNSGTLSIRRRFINRTGQNVARLRFRVVDITTLGTPIGIAPQADLRLITSGDFGITTSLGNLTVRGTALEEPPDQINGGGLNSSVTVFLPGGGLPQNASIDVQFLLNVVQAGSFRFFINVEALPQGSQFAGPRQQRKLQAQPASKLSP